MDHLDVEEWLLSISPEGCAEVLLAVLKKSPSVSDLVLKESRDQIADLEAILKIAQESNCGFVEQNNKLIRRNLALGDVPYEYGSNPLCGKCDGRRDT